MRILLSALLIVMFGAPAMAVVDMKDANYADTWNDMNVSGTGFELRVRRTYNSRSLFNGMFGFGWCSDFETKIETTAEGNLKLTECGGGLDIVYAPKTFNKKEVDQTVNQIISRMQAKDSGLTAKNVAQLRTELLNDVTKRSQRATEVGLTPPTIKEGTIFLANGQQVENIVLKDNFYIRSMADGSSQKFDRSGKLTFLYDKNSNFLKLVYDQNRLQEVQDNKGRKLSIKINKVSGKVTDITGPSGLTCNYKYNGDDLVAVTNSWKNRYTYAYSDNHNLTRINYPDGTFKALTYNEDKDWVMSFTDRAKCVETYAYELSADDPKNHYTSKVEKKCKGAVTNFAKYEFWHKDRNDGVGKVLARVKSTSKNEELDITYHEIFGRPVQVVRNGFTETYNYYPNGLIEVRNNRYQNMSFEYDKATKKISVVKTQFKDDKGKVVRTRNTEFKYDDKANLTYAANSDGQKVWLTYDARGRIATIKDQAKKVVEIKYEEKYGKPSVVTRPGLGTILVTYNADGQIDKVDSKQGPTVAVQVASTFNNLLDVISPANNGQNI